MAGDFCGRSGLPQLGVVLVNIYFMHMTKERSKNPRHNIPAHVSNKKNWHCRSIMSPPCIMCSQWNCHLSKSLVSKYLGRGITLERSTISWLENKGDYRKSGFGTNWEKKIYNFDKFDLNVTKTYCRNHWDLLYWP